MTPNGAVSVAFLGVARPTSESFLTAFRSLRVSITGVYDSETTRASQWGIHHRVQPFDTMAGLLATHPQAVVIAAETHRSADFAADAVQAGAAVFMVGPAALTAEGVEECVSFAARNNVLWMPAYQRRFNPAIIQAREVVQAGTLGALRVVLVAGRSWPPAGNWHWLSDPARSGGGALISRGPLVDAALWMVGGEPTMVSGHMHPTAPTGVETAATCLCDFPGDVSVSIEASWARREGMPPERTAAITLVGDEGTIDVEPDIQAIKRYGGSPEVKWSPFAVSNERLLVANFLGAVKGDTDPGVGGTDAIRVARVTHAAYRSARAGEPQALALSAWPEEPASA